MEEISNKLCIFIASHLSKSNRISYLKECLESLLQQTIPIPIYLSISFETYAIKKQFLDDNDIIELSGKINLRIRERKTSQMQHINLLYLEIATLYDWVMFCDDDDKYYSKRVEKITQLIYAGNIEAKRIQKILGGVYESSFGKDHREHRHEYWCYCVNIIMFQRFYERLLENPDIINNKCCDVMFAEYLRRSGPEYIFYRLEEVLYYYRVEDNMDSITGHIRGSKKKYTRSTDAPSITDVNFSDYVVDWNDCLYENMDVYLHDVFLRTIVGSDLEYILKSEFRADYELLPFVDSCHVERIKKEHEYWLGICNKLYDIRL
jgi:glycosyltransferase involved in cell wall biosynthesis